MYSPPKFIKNAKIIIFLTLICPNADNDVRNFGCLGLVGQAEELGRNSLCLGRSCSFTSKAGPGRHIKSNFCLQHFESLDLDQRLAVRFGDSCKKKSSIFFCDQNSKEFEILVSDVTELFIQIYLPNEEDTSVLPYK